MGTVSTAVGSQRTPTAKPLKNTHRHHKIPRCAQRTIQKRKRLFSGQAANPSEHQGCKETDQPSNLADTTEPLQKRPRTERSPEEPANQPIIRLSKCKAELIECSDLIRWCLRPNEEDRPSLEEIEFHQWFY
ncbi:hypothetical protein KOW79_000946 [Hemibagrus wyckioides]|uniref:Uncharacterized protein n=1 Tax=Hemibagrus wyckioides TaxID=337641 RepID=A0A9D3PBB0_9TELE|nr:hypothetical protein KOW79_000945 [Hemibagrus wyckioides]KAG7336253.1 hypothetical protein KOW79_000946 [Hemibagrus wyckioides]